MGESRFRQCAFDFPTGEIRGVGDPVSGVSAFPTQSELLAAGTVFARELRAPGDEFPNHPGAFGYHEIHDIPPAEAGARRQSVFRV